MKRKHPYMKLVKVDRSTGEMLWFIPAKEKRVIKNKQNDSYNSEEKESNQDEE